MAKKQLSVKSSTSINVSQKSIDAFSSKLEAWGKTLPQQDFDLLKVVLGRAAASDPAKMGFTVHPSVSGAIVEVFKPLQAGTLTARANSWIKGGPGWARWSKQAMGGFDPRSEISAPIVRTRTKVK